MDVSGFALVIGGGSGIGAACALGFAKEGAAGVMIAEIDLTAAKCVATTCLASAATPNFRVDVTHMDVTSEESVKNAAKHTLDVFGRIDYCVNNAGIGVQKAAEIADANASEFNQFLSVNATGTFLVTREVSALMRAQQPRVVLDNSRRGVVRGIIVNMGSLASFVAQPGMTQYTASKHAVLGITRNAALDNAQHGIRVNCVCPSWVDTPMVKRAMEQVKGLNEMVKRAVPFGRIADPAEVADVVIFLCSPRSSYGFPAPGLRRTVRYITGHNADGKGVFLSTDCGDHHRIIGDQQALGNILYSTIETPVDLGNDKDITHAKENEPPLHYHNGTVLRMIDFSPGLVSPMHRAVSLDYGVVLEGEFEMTLDSGETRIMRQGDVCINRGCAHAWRNITGNGTMPGRMLYILIDSKPVITAQGEELGEYLAELAPYYENRAKDSAEKQEQQQ
ncbi:hypothetical protein GGR51DRAFT_546056 [Nemania sp. FL0031]|nr:hypothetical protein GGR51DRAFT_546056 [Nemania sp. FL0031]